MGLGIPSYRSDTTRAPGSGSATTGSNPGGFPQITPYGSGGYGTGDHNTPYIGNMPSLGARKQMGPAPTRYEDGSYSYGTTFYPGSSNNAADDAYQQYQEAMARQQQAAYTSAQQGLGLDRDFSLGMGAANNASAQSQYDLAMRGIGLDENRLRDMAALAQQNAQAQGGFADARWSELQRGNSANRGFVDRDLALRQALNAKNVGFNNQGFNLNMQGIGQQYARSYRQENTDAVARGARSSRGHSDTIEEFQDQRDLSGSQARLSHSERAAGLESERNMNQLNYEQAVEGLLSQYNNGRITWQEAQQGIQQALAQNRIGLEHGLAQGGLQRDAAGQQLTDAQARNALEQWQALERNRLDQQALFGSYGPSVVQHTQGQGTYR